MAPSRSRTRQTSATTAGDAGTTATVVQTDQRPEGWEVGNRAPSDKFAPLDVATGQPDLEKVTAKAPKGYGVQLVVAGATITQENRYDLGLDQRDPAETVRTPADQPQGPGQVAPS